MNNIVRKLILTAALCSTSLLVTATKVDAQTRFAKPDTAVDVSRYKTVEECMALRNRLSQREIRKLPYWQDTLKYNQSEKRNPYPAPVRDTLALCLEKFSVASVDYGNFSEYLDWITVFYDAMRDSDADSVIAKKLSTAKWGKEDTAGLHKVLGDILVSIQRGKGLRWDTFVKLSSIIDSAGDRAPWKDKISIYNSLFTLSEEFDDSAVQKSSAEKIIAIEKTLTDKDKLNRFWLFGGRIYALNAMDFLHNREMLDSLRASAKSYVSFRNSYWERVRGENADKLPDYSGESAKPVTGDFWFKREGDKVSRLPQAPGSLPASGRISLVVFYDIRCEDNTPVFIGQYHRFYPGGQCLASYPILRRMVEQYPSLQVTIVSLTDGFIGNTEPMSPEEEAEQKSNWWLSTHKLPATLAVSEQEFFKLPAPDGRRVDTPHENSINYLFGSGATRVPSSTAFLIDVDGTILYGNGLSRFSERKFTELLNVITNRK